MQGNAFRIVWSVHALGVPFPVQIVFSVPKRLLIIVDRNRIKRLMREYYRQNSRDLFVGKRKRLLLFVYTGKTIPGYQDVVQKNVANQQTFCGRFSKTFWLSCSLVWSGFTVGLCHHCFGHLVGLFPTCSAYGIQAIRKYGPSKAVTWRYEEFWDVIPGVDMVMILFPGKIMMKWNEELQTGSPRDSNISGFNISFSFVDEYLEVSKTSIFFQLYIVKSTCFMLIPLGKSWYRRNWFHAWVTGSIHQFYSWIDIEDYRFWLQVSMRVLAR